MRSEDIREWWGIAIRPRTLLGHGVFALVTVVYQSTVFFAVALQVHIVALGIGLLVLARVLLGRNARAAVSWNSFVNMMILLGARQAFAWLAPITAGIALMQSFDHRSDLTALLGGGFLALLAYVLGLTLLEVLARVFASIGNVPIDGHLIPRRDEPTVGSLTDLLADTERVLSDEWSRR